MSARASSPFGFLRAVSLLMATTIGVGVFALPFVGVRAGYGLLLGYLVVLGAFVLLMQLMYGEVVLRTPHIHHPPGYAEQYLGRWGKHLVFITSIASLYGTLLAYIILGSHFLDRLLESVPGVPGMAGFAVFALATGLILIFGNRVITRVDFVVSLVFILVILLFFFVGGPHVRLPNLSLSTPGSLFLPYGAVLFALWGMKTVPEMRTPLAGRERFLGRAILYAVLVVVSIYALFTFLVIGIAGRNVTEDALSSLVPFLGQRAAMIGYAFGALATFTSFLSLGLAVMNTYRYDFHLRGTTAWVMTVSVPIALYLAGFTSFVDVISKTGALFLGIEGLTVIALYAAARRRSSVRPAYDLHIPSWALWVLTALLITGAIAAW